MAQHVPGFGKGAGARRHQKGRPRGPSLPQRCTPYGASSRRCLPSVQTFDLVALGCARAQNTHLVQQQPAPVYYTSSLCARGLVVHV